MNSRILYIEDNEQNLYLVTFILQARGYEVIPARSGEEGIALAAEVRARLILLDIQLPGLDGYEIARRLRQNPDLATTPIVAVTSYGMEGDREKALAAGCDGHIVKPINPDTFTSEIERFMEPEEER